eukprot:166659-Lingulodinium_polyedra.AAC.1
MPIADGLPVAFREEVDIARRGARTEEQPPRHEPSATEVGAAVGEQHVLLVRANVRYHAKDVLQASNGIRGTRFKR